MAQPLVQVQVRTPLVSVPATPEPLQKDILKAKH